MSECSGKTTRLLSLSTGEVQALCENLSRLRREGVTCVRDGDFEVHMLPMAAPTAELRLADLEQMPLGPDEDWGDREVEKARILEELEKKRREEAETVMYGAG